MATLPAASFPPDDEPLADLAAADARAASPDADIADHSKTQVAENFWQKEWVQNVLPLATSITLHVAIIVLMILLIPPLKRAYTQVTQEQVIIPDATFAEGNEPGGIPNPGLGNDPTRQARQDQFANVAPNSESWAQKPSQTLAQTMMSGGLGEQAGDISVIGPGAATGAGKSSGIGAGNGAGAGTGDGSGALAPFGPGGGGGGVGPKFMKVGFGGNVSSIIFVCDASGSMMDKLATLKDELKSAVDRLKPRQWFDVVFFADAKPQVLSPQMVPASPDNKSQLFSFLTNVRALGSTDPIPGLEFAFRQQPQLIFLLTDGDFPDNQAVLNRVRQLNPEKKVHVNTIAFVNEQNKDVEFINILKQIAKENGGVFKRVSEDELH